MLTLQAREVLFMLKDLSNNTNKLMYRDDFVETFQIADEKVFRSYSKYSSEIESILELLQSDGLIVIDEHDDTVFHLTQFAIHYWQYRATAVLKYIASKWIDFFALATAVAALIVSLSK